jgi:hypothetical protein
MPIPGLRQKLLGVLIEGLPSHAHEDGVPTGPPKFHSSQFIAPAGNDTEIPATAIAQCSL